MASINEVWIINDVEVCLMYSGRLIWIVVVGFCQPPERVVRLYVMQKVVLFWRQGGIWTNSQSFGIKLIEFVSNQLKSFRPV